MQFLGKDIKNVEMFNEGLIANWTELYHKYSGTSFEAKNGDTLHYYKEPNYLGEEGDIFRLAFIHTADGTLYQLGVVKEPYMIIDSEVFAEAHKNALTTIKAENPPVDGPKDEVPTPDQPTKEVEDPAVEPKPEEPKEDKPVDEAPKDEAPVEDKPAEDKPKEEEPKTEAPAEELPEARRDEKVYFEAGRYFVERTEEGSGDISRVTVKPAKNAYDVATGEMILEDAPEGEEILQDDLGRHYYVDKKLDKLIYVKPKKADAPAEEPREDKPVEDTPKEEEPKPEEPKEDKPADETPKEETPGEGSVDTPDTPEVPKDEEPKEKHPLLNGEPVTNARTNDVVQSWLSQLEGKGYSHNVAGTIRIYELLKAIANGEITIEVFFHELASGVLSKTEMTKAEASIDFFALRQEVNALIEKYLKEIDTPR